MDKGRLTTNRPEKNLKKRFTFRFYAELNDFLPLEKKQHCFEHTFKTPVTVRETIESFGIPLSEIDLILVNSMPVELEHRLKEGDSVSVYPMFESMDITAVTKTRKTPLRNPEFIVDAHLGKLAKYLRMLGFDTIYKPDIADDEIISIAKAEKRIILTRDKLLLRSKEVTHGYYVRAIEKHEQLKEVVHRFDLSGKFKSFTRCMTCNAQLIPKCREEVADKIEPDTGRIFNEFFYCPDCEKVFWKGSHFERMEKLILSLL
ncbi:MAG: Mut7-C RNAse domain-containing protein [Bacteroidales bacterium]|jgi:uncharacterized protein with PIN domain